MTHPERIAEIRANAATWYRARDHFEMSGAIEALLDALTASEKRASEAERTFAGLHTEMAKIVALNAQLVRRAEDAEADCGIATIARRRAEQERDDRARAELSFANRLAEAVLARRNAESQRDSAREALGKVENWCVNCHATSPNNKLCGTCNGPILQVLRPARTALTHTGNDG